MRSNLVGAAVCVFGIERPTRLQGHECLRGQLASAGARNRHVAKEGSPPTRRFDRCNGHMHYGDFQSVLLNDKYVPVDTLTVLDQLENDVADLFVLHLAGRLFH